MGGRAGFLQEETNEAAFLRKRIADLELENNQLKQSSGGDSPYSHSPGMGAASG